MELIESEQPQTPPLAEPEPRYHTASLPIEKTEHGQSLLRTLAAILVGLILIVLIVLLARWIYHKSHHAVAPTPAGTSQQSAAKSSANKTSGAQPANNSAAGSASGSTTPQTGSSTAGSNTQITNTGPGETAAIFVGASLAAAGLHYIISLRRQQA